MKKFTHEIGEFNNHDSSGVYFEVQSSDGGPVLAVYPANGVGDGEGWDLDANEVRELVGKLQEALTIMEGEAA